MPYITIVCDNEDCHNFRQQIKTIQTPDEEEGGSFEFQTLTMGISVEDTKCEGCGQNGVPLPSVQ